MKIGTTSVTVVLYKAKKLAKGSHPLMVRVYKDYQSKYKAIGIRLTPKDWDEKKAEVKRSHPERDLMNHVIAQTLQNYREAIQAFILEGKDFTPDYLIDSLEKFNKKITFYQYFKLRIESLNEANQVGNAKVYHDTLNQLILFTKNKDYTFEEVDISFLNKFYNKMKSMNLTDSTMSVRFRTIRAVFNSAQKEGYISKELYPFKDFKISTLFSSKTSKRAIPKSELQKIESLDLSKGSKIWEAQQFFLFSYYGQGINFIDIAHLKWENIVNNRVYYRRMKTGEPMNFLIQPFHQLLFDFYRPLTYSSNDAYIFQILNKKAHLTAKQRQNRTHKVITRVNQDLKTIAQMAGISTPLTTYVARHTFATVLKHSKNVPISVISQAMGHQTEAITNTYLADFDNSVIDDAMENLY